MVLLAAWMAVFVIVLECVDVLHLITLVLNAPHVRKPFANLFKILTFLCFKKLLEVVLLPVAWMVDLAIWKMVVVAAK